MYMEKGRNRIVGEKENTVERVSKYIERVD